MKSTKAIVLHHINYSDTSVIAYLLTQSEGFQTFIVKGARKPKAKIKKSIFLPLHELDISYYPKKSENALGLLSSAHVSKLHQELTSDMVKSSLSFFVAEVCYKTLKQEPQNASLYAFLDEFIGHLNKATTLQLTLVPQYFMLRLASFLGFFPSMSQMEANYFDLEDGEFVYTKPKHGAFLDADESELLKQINQTSFSDLGELTKHKRFRHQLLDKLCLFYQLHVEGFGELKSLDVLKALFQVM